MSHYPERPEKDCLNCGAVVHGKYCHICGQENRIPKDSAWGLVTHYFYDLFHFDGKFFYTVHYLWRKPGFLPAEYVRGRRATYLDPVKMYVFTSAVFFLIFFTFIIPNRRLTDQVQQEEKQQVAKIDSLQQAIKKKQDSLLQTMPQPDSTKRKNIIGDSTRNGRGNAMVFFSDSVEYKNLQQYDSLQATLPAGKRDGWLKRLMIRRGLEISEVSEKRGADETSEYFRDKLAHKLPQMMFISLPFFALWLKVLYRRRKRYYYVDHGIFGVYQYIFSFIAVLVIYLLSLLQDTMGWEWMDFLQFAIVMYVLYYLYKSMRNFYGDSRRKTLAKFFLLNFLMLMTMTLLMVIMVSITVFQI